MINFTEIAANELMELDELDSIMQNEDTEITDQDADRLIRIYKAIAADKERFRQLKEKQVEELTARYELKAEKYDKELGGIALQLQKFAQGQKMKETKTQAKYQLLSGDIIIKKPVKQLKADNAALLEAINGTEYSGYVRIKTEVAWADLKKRLDFTDDGMILDKETGEIIELAGLSVEEKAGGVEIK